jgi:hypothetical protein
MNAHSARHWDVMTTLSRPDPASITSTERLVDAINQRFRGRDIVIIGDADRTGYPHLTSALHRYGIQTMHQSFDETDRQSTKTWQCVFELPLLNGRRELCRRIHRKTSFVIEPYPHLSGQFVLALLSNAQQDIAVSDILQNRILDEDALALLQLRIPKTYSLASTGVPPDALVKAAPPLSSQRCLGRYDQIAPRIDLTECLYRFVAQERIAPFRIAIPNENNHCPVRLIFVSYRGEVLTGMAVVRIPSNGHPERDVALDLVQR